LFLVFVWLTSDLCRVSGLVLQDPLVLEMLANGTHRQMMMQTPPIQMPPNWRSNAFSIVRKIENKYDATALKPKIPQFLHNSVLQPSEIGWWSCTREPISSLSRQIYHLRSEAKPFFVRSLRGNYLVLISGLNLWMTPHLQ
jgi:hypothetical protein